MLLHNLELQDGVIFCYHLMYVWSQLNWVIVLFSFGCISQNTSNISFFCQLISTSRMTKAIQKCALKGTIYKILNVADNSLTERPSHNQSISNPSISLTKKFIIVIRLTTMDVAVESKGQVSNVVARFIL